MIDINSKEVVAFTNKLERMHRSNLPVAIRSALNDAAFDMKKNQLPRTFDDSFTVRKKTFLRSHTSVNKSKNTFDIKQMHSEAGVIKGKSEAGNELEIQEKGGNIPDREFIPMDPSRVGKNKAKLVSKKFYLAKIKAKRHTKKEQNQEFIRAALKAGKGGFVRYDDYLFHIRTIKKPRRDKIFIKSDPVYSFKENRSVRLKATHFVEKAGKLSAKKLPEFFINQAKRRLNK